MTLRNFLNTYDGCSLISIKGYCEEHDKDTIKLEDWYKEIKTRTVKRWVTMGGGNYPEEIYIEILPLEKN